MTEDFADTEDLDGVFSGLDREHRSYDFDAWRYQGGEMSAAAGRRDRVQPDREQRDVRQRGPRARHTARAVPTPTPIRTATRRCSTRDACSRS